MSHCELRKESLNELSAVQQHEQSGSCWQTENQQVASPSVVHQKAKTMACLIGYSLQTVRDQCAAGLLMLVWRRETFGFSHRTGSPQVAFLAVVRHQWVCSVTLMEGCVVCCLP